MHAILVHARVRPIPGRGSRGVVARLGRVDLRPVVFAVSLGLLAVACDSGDDGQQIGERVRPAAPAPQSAAAGLEQVLAVLDGLRNEGLEVDVTDLGATYTHGTGQREDRIDVRMALLIRGPEAVASTRQFATFKERVRALDSFVSLSDSSTEELEGGAIHAPSLSLRLGLPETSQVDGSPIVDLDAVPDPSLTIRAAAAQPAADIGALSINPRGATTPGAGVRDEHYDVERSAGREGLPLERLRAFMKGIEAGDDTLRVTDIGLQPVPLWRAGQSSSPPTDWRFQLTVSRRVKVPR